MPDQQLDSEIRLTAIFAVGAGLFVVTIAVTILMWFLSTALRSHVESNDPVPAALPEARIQELPTGPVLQADPIGELAKMRSEEDSALDTLEWIDEASGTVRLPIEIAIEVVAAAGGLPSGSFTNTDAEEP